MSPGSVAFVQRQTNFQTQVSSKPGSRCPPSSAWCGSSPAFSGRDSSPRPATAPGRGSRQLSAVLSLCGLCRGCCVLRSSEHVQVSEVSRSKGSRGFTGPGEKRVEKVSAWAGKETGVCFLLPPALEVILKGLARKLAASEVRSLSIWGVTWNMAQFSISGAPDRDRERFVRNTCPRRTRSALAHALKGLLDLK